ncbi:hypothetical protein KJ671_01250 [Patescibacteria group bacterium]|nr:hypothetical protein [Patescibacteria group bacterium]
MSVFKIIITTLILGLGLTGAYLIVSNSNSPAPAKISNTENVIENNPVEIELIGTSNNKNLTDALTEKISAGIAEKNLEGLKNIDGETMINAPAPEKMVEDLIVEAQKNFNPASLRPKIDNSSLKISEDNNKEALLEYFNSFNNILITASKKMPASMMSNPESLDIYDFVKIKEAYKYAIDALYNITIPRLALNIHKKEIELLSIKKNIFEKGANAGEDPVSAILAANELLKTNEEFVILSIEIKDFIETHLD